MNRKLILIISDGGGNSPLKGVHKDKDNYLDFFKSPEGGAWMDDEIKVYDHNDFYLDALRVLDLNARLTKPIEYYLIVYCGHGYTDEQSRIHLEVRPDCDLLLDDLQATVARSRYLIISDSCRAVVRLKEGGRINHRVFSAGDVARQSAYADLCRDYYNEKVAQTPQNMHMVLFADSFSETAGETKNGGYYSYALMESAREAKIDANNKQKLYACSYSYSVDDIHQMAAQKVRNQTHDTQHPEIVENSRNANRLPFVVVPHWLLQFEDEE